MEDSTATPSVEELEREYAEGKGRARRLHLYARLLSISLTLLIVGFLWSIVALARDLYAWENFEPALKAEAERLTPEAKASANRVFGRVGPVYAELAQEKLDRALPAVQEAMRSEFEAMGSGIVQRTGPQVEEVLERLEAKQWERVSHHFPSLSTEARRAEFAERWKMEILDQNRDILHEYDLKFGQEVLHLRRTLDGFRPNRFEKWDEERLTRHFVHLWLQLLDRHILSKDYPGDVEEVNHDR